ncbi:PREDICTED: uncharacterized protein LOC104712782 isoform X2 [Camelina sativa]|uniref:Uncharacterized protein LOC104712782 isoform X2 n=1 Tax=Camelina sativa TaxID=90675 RepID=A0ABM0TLA7_CAMSA|nr:PREDICTED: uncharacterized protein LOC104712782 isoform X2 [Camelina sativa]
MAYLQQSLYSAVRREFTYQGRSGQGKDQEKLTWRRFPVKVRCASTESLTSLTQNHAAETELKYLAEVLSALLYKLKNSPPDRYACLVAEQTSEAETSSSTSVVGVVDVTAQTESSVLCHFPGVEEYLYVSGLAVSKAQRRKRMGSTLLKACDVLCYLWGFKLLALRAYEDDAAARNLYSNAGYDVVATDPLWTSTWIGRKRRVLMTKRFS